MILLLLACLPTAPEVGMCLTQCQSASPAGPEGFQMATTAEVDVLLWNDGTRTATCVCTFDSTKLVRRLSP